MWTALSRAWARRREARALRRHAIPEALWQLTLLRYPFLAERNAADLAELRRLCSLFLSAKEFHGVGGFEVGDDVAVAVAAQACLPVLRLGLSWYEGFVGIVMHADEVVAQREFMDEDGVVHAYEEELAGEAMEGGPLMLTWSAMADWDYPTAPQDQAIFNVVIHEFAHVIDMRDGWADGAPPLASSGARAQWLAVLEGEWQRFCERVDAGLATLIDPYGAESPEEFFAVAVEAFFVAPKAMRTEEPAMYQLLADFFRQDPAA
ncbi:Mlc titration factor MtfA (ptsG expression regulator) [Paucibacter oligotrophus]|uniref:Mlc titration factor MtfA (PtsG expression regulator) n=1 Tax=Roseateles oligotrophus TaxID=1769250 RepID=A0A840L5P3_9BURK|nr:M90 family metallopeptidase [Roseateles oligotrophus]MBB4841875.1 Mlc titration factor MtfA (ptsG expression regulator) [Roseateles oligotrophus]